MLCHGLKRHRTPFLVKTNPESLKNLMPPKEMKTHAELLGKADSCLELLGADLQAVGVVTATVLTNGLLQMNLAYEAKEAKADGSRTNNFSQHSRFLLPAGKQCAVKFGPDLMVVMRPRLLTP